MQFEQYVIRIGSFGIHYYALILMAGILVAGRVSAMRAKARGKSPDLIWDGLVWVIIPGLIGARLYHVFTPSPASGLSLQYYLQHPEQILAIWNGGLGIYGAIAGGVLGAWLYARYKHEPFGQWADILAPALPLAQAIGRWGNYVNHELYGAATTLPWKMYIPPGKRQRGFEGEEFYHPLFLYESLLNILAFIALLVIERRFRERLRAGDLFLIYLIFYALIRFSLDFLRLDSHGFGALTTAQGLAILIVIGAAIGIYVNHRRAPIAQMA
jgi:phosphatidylglycerol:prolipoprotein diacylglycerol transferase